MMIVVTLHPIDGLYLIMASNVQVLKGYKHQFVEPPPDDLLCLICLSVAREPQQTSCCGKVLCKECLDELKEHSNLCPQCRVDIVSFADKRSDRHILSLKAQCDNTSNGCEWTGVLRSLKEHLTNCNFTLLPCPNECKEGSRVHRLLRKDMEQHKQEECVRRQYECRHCKETGEYLERTTVHLEICPMVEIRCPNAQCDTLVPRSSISLHRRVCMYEEVSCKYANIGCPNKVLRKDLKEHEDDSKQHLQLAINTVHQLKSMATKQDAIIAQIQSSQNKPIIFRVSNFEHLKSSSEVYYTPAYYTSPDGYKMCIRVAANGTKEGTGTHVSVYIHFMQGENDDHLPWPFTGKVTIELLNQLEGNNHHSKITTFPQEHEASRRVVNREKALVGYGRPCFISHSDLGYKEAKNCQYLKDDCLYFRISSVAESSSKPWLAVNIQY